MKSNKERANELISQMTLDEKIAQLGSCWMFELQTGGILDPVKVRNKMVHGIGQITRIAGASTLDPVGAAVFGNQIQKFLVKETRLGIPAILHEESCSGAMVLGGTAFPQMIGLASTFQPDLAEQMTINIRKQLLAIGARQTLAPVLDVSRDPRWGRTEETFGEDPTLVSHFGMAYIRGMQGDDLKNGVMATGKHFIGHSLSQGGQNCAPVHVGIHDLYDVFLVPFQAAIRDAHLASIMNSYPELDGEVVATSRRILTDLLRGELGFDGIVVSDYEAILMIHNFHHAASDPASAGRLAISAGIDVELPTTVCYGDPLKKSLEAGELNMEFLDTSVLRHLQKKFELGLFDQPYANEGHVLEVYETHEQRKLARKIAQQSMVLLKNDGVLPFNKNIKTLAVIGPNAASKRNLLGDYSFTATSELMAFLTPPDSSFVNIDPVEIGKHDLKVVTILDGIKEIVSPATQVLYARGCDNLDPDTTGFAEAIKTAERSDVIILVLGDHSGLVPACTTGETRDSADLHLPGVQNELAERMISIGKPVVLVLVTGRPYAISRLNEAVNAILEAWLPGEEGGHAVAEVLFGEVNPGGKLPVTFPRQVGQLPIFYNHKPSGMKSHWYGDYVSEKATPLFPFGHGLSYTQFEYADLSLDRVQATSGQVVEISAKVTNIGPVPGDEVVQLYVRDEVASLPRPMQELKGFVRLSLQPGESRLVTFKLPVDQIAFYDSSLNLVLEPGSVSVMLGSSCIDIRLKGEFEITGQAKIQVKKRVFVCPVEIGN